MLTKATVFLTVLHKGDMLTHISLFVLIVLFFCRHGKLTTFIFKSAAFQCGLSAIIIGDCFIRNVFLSAAVLELAILKKSMDERNVIHTFCLNLFFC